MNDFLPSGNFVERTMVKIHEAALGLKEFVCDHGFFVFVWPRGMVYVRKINTYNASLSKKSISCRLVKLTFLLLPKADSKVDSVAGCGVLLGFIFTSCPIKVSPAGMRWRVRP